MPVARKIAGYIEKSSWIRKMFEEGAKLRAEFGADRVYDFTLGNPDVEPPKAFHDSFLELAKAPLPGMHRYMNNAGYTETRDAVARVLERRPRWPNRWRPRAKPSWAGSARGWPPRLYQNSPAVAVRRLNLIW